MDRATWQFINGFADWFSAVGTIAAVVVALWLARRDARPRLRVSSGIYKMLTVGQKPADALSYFNVFAVNIGLREIVVSGLTWRVGYLRKHRMVQIPPDPPLGPQLPLRLKSGDDVKFLFDVSAFHKEIATVRQDVASRILPAVTARTIRVGVYLSTGEEILSRVDASSRGLILSDSYKSELP